MRLISQMTLQNNLKKATLGGCIVEKIKETVIIRKNIAEVKLPQK